jgi:hypothetical protein
MGDFYLKLLAINAFRPYIYIIKSGLHKAVMYFHICSKYYVEDVEI